MDWKTYLDGFLKNVLRLPKNYSTWVVAAIFFFIENQEARDWLFATFPWIGQYPALTGIVTFLVSRALPQIAAAVAAQQGAEASPPPPPASPPAAAPTLTPEQAAKVVAWYPEAQRIISKQEKQ